MQVNMIKYCLYGATSAREKRHAQDVMESLGITYAHATPQSLFDQWWFWLPKNIPDELPDFITILKVNPRKHIGNGLSKKVAKSLLELDKEKD